SVQASIAGGAPARGLLWRPYGHQATLPFKRRLTRLKRTNYCTHFSLQSGQHIGEDDTSRPATTRAPRPSAARRARRGRGRRCNERYLAAQLLLKGRRRIEICCRTRNAATIPDN